MSETCSRCGAILNMSRAFVAQHGAKCTQCNTLWALPVSDDLEAGEAALFDPTTFCIGKVANSPYVAYPTTALKAGDYVRADRGARELTKVELSE
jgi:hypothetical protein